MSYYPYSIHCLLAYIIGSKSRGTVSKMVKITVKDFSNDELEKRWNALTNKDNWEEECEWCKMPGMLHKGPCTRKEETNAFEYQKIYEGWNLYRNRMKPIIELKQKQEEKIDDSGMEKFATIVSGAFTTAQKKGGEEGMKEFRDKYRELKIETNRVKKNRFILHGASKFVKAEIPQSAESKKRFTGKRLLPRKERKK